MSCHATAAACRDEYERDKQLVSRRQFAPGYVQAHHRRLRRWDVLWGVLQLSMRYRALDKR